MKRVYFDNAATTRLREKVIERMSEVLENNFGNPSSTHYYGRESKSLVETARKTVAGYLNVSPAEIIFTSGGTEADNLILKSCVNDLGVERIISSSIEHHAVLYTLQRLQKETPVEVVFVQLDSCGGVNYSHLEKLLSDTSKKTLVSLMHINNEVGTILDIELVAGLCKKYDALFHSDTVQSIGHYSLDLEKIPVDFTAVAAHKFHGPKGIGFAFIRKNSGLKSIICGGEQERGLRAGTEAVHNIAGMETALRIAYENLEKEKEYVLGIKNYFVEQLKEHVPGVKFNAQCDKETKSTYTLINACLPVSEDKSLMLLFQLDLHGIACSKGSACQSGSSKGSHVLEAILSEEDLKKPSVRFSFSIFNTKDEVDYVVEVLKKFVETPVTKTSS